MVIRENAISTHVHKHIYWQQSLSEEGAEAVGGK